MRKRACLLLVAICLAAAPAGARAGEEPPPSEQEVVERILELQRQIEALLELLPAERREEVRRRLAAPPAGGVGRGAPAGDLSSGAAASAEAPSAPAPPPPAPQPPPPSPRSCDALALLDENGDGSVDWGDRYWRYLYLWRDRDGDGRASEREVESAYEAGVRSISVDLRWFENAKGHRGEVRADRYLLLDLTGDGLGVAGHRGDAGALAIDASALGRGGGPQLLAADGTAIEGIRPFVAGWQWRGEDGATILLSCP